ncbi:hypothetical protein Pen01_51960 [Phytomonospora endophytica]|nr:hypothetical protein Pen01_51960 [Phytomonospora endophytica]
MALVGTAALASAAVSDPGERITNMWVGAELQADGSAHVTEVIDYVFADGPRHGIYRVVPGSDSAESESVTVTMDGATVLFDAEDTTGMLRIKVGDPDATVTGTHRYRIEYTLATLSDDGYLSWDAVGDRWEVPIDRAEVHLTAPVALDNLSCASGGDGIDADCTIAQPSPGRFDVTHERLDADAGLTLRADDSDPVDTAPLPQAPTGKAEAVATGDGVLSGALWAAAIALLAAVVVTAAIRFAGRQRIESSDGMDRRRGLGRLARETTPSPEPPRELGPAHAAVLHTDRVLREHQSAFLLGAALDGHLTITGNKKRPVLRRGSGGPRARGLTEHVLHTLFSNGGKVYLGQYTKSFGAAWKLIGRGLEEWRRDAEEGMWEPGGTVRRRIATWLGLAMAVAGGVTVAVTATDVPTPGADWRTALAIGAGLAGAGIAAFFSAWELRVRTPRGTRLWCETEAYRRHLAGLTREQWATGNREAMTAWAVALGQTKPVVTASAASAHEPAHQAIYTPELAFGLQIVAIQTAVAPSASGSWYSSSSGGYSGGYSGGGDGGGGGGGGGGGDGGGGGSW